MHNIKRKFFSENEQNIEFKNIFIRFDHRHTIHQKKGKVIKNHRPIYLKHDCILVILKSKKKGMKG